jgi:hypothetical protein
MFIKLSRVCKRHRSDWIRPLRPVGAARPLQTVDVRLVFHAAFAGRDAMTQPFASETLRLGIMSTFFFIRMWKC